MKRRVQACAAGSARAFTPPQVPDGDTRGISTGEAAQGKEGLWGIEMNQES